LGRAERVVAQARNRLAGVMAESVRRLVSLHDVEARPIRKGRLGKPVEFGYSGNPAQGQTRCRPPRVRARRAFRAKVKWRTGSEGRISHLKRSYGWNRTELTGIHGARTWCGHGVFAHNLVKIGALAA